MGLEMLRGAAAAALLGCWRRWRRALGRHAARCATGAGWRGRTALLGVVWRCSLQRACSTDGAVASRWRPRRPQPGRLQVQGRNPSPNPDISQACDLGLSALGVLHYNALLSLPPLLLGAAVEAPRLAAYAHWGEPRFYCLLLTNAALGGALPLLLCPC